MRSSHEPFLTQVFVTVTVTRLPGVSKLEYLPTVPLVCSYHSRTKLLCLKHSPRAGRTMAYCLRSDIIPIC